MQVLNTYLCDDTPFLVNGCILRATVVPILELLARRAKVMDALCYKLGDIILDI